MSLLDVEPRIEVVRANLPSDLRQKVDDLGDRLSLALPPERRDSEFLRGVKELLVATINEESTDALIDMIKPFAPWGLGWAVGYVLDKLLPEQVLALAFQLLNRLET